MNTNEIFNAVNKIAKTIAQSVYIEDAQADHGDAVMDIPELVENYCSGVVAVELFSKHYADTLPGYLDKLNTAGYTVPDIKTASIKELIQFVSETGGIAYYGLVFNPDDNSLTIIYNGKMTKKSEMEALAVAVKLNTQHTPWDDIDIMEFGELPE